MDLGRRGAFFSLFVIMALVLVIFTVRLENQYREGRRADLFDERVSKLSFFVEDVQADLDNAVELTAYRALLAANEHIARNIGNGVPLDEAYFENASLNLSSLIRWGNLSSEVTQPTATNTSTLVDWNATIHNLSKRLGLDVHFNLTEINVSMHDAWHVNISISGDLYVRDPSGTVSWNVSIERDVLFDYTKGRGVLDPLYFRADDATLEFLKYNNTIRRTRWSVSGLWRNVSSVPPPTNYQEDIRNLTNHIQEQRYFHHDIAPTLLMRLEGDDDCANDWEECEKAGIESFVNQQEFGAVTGGSPGIANAPGARHPQGGPPCTIDHQFYSRDPAHACGISTRHIIEGRIFALAPPDPGYLVDTVGEPPTDFVYLNKTHMDFYNLTGLNQSFPPNNPS